MTACRIDVHVWEMAAAGHELSRLEGLLSPKEMVRARRFACARDRHRFIIAHGRMREILGRHVGAGAKELAFAKGPRGKPFLKESGPFFSLSHSVELACLAVCEDCEIGLDIEKIGSLPKENVEQFFSPRERKELAELEGEDKRQCFYNCWVRKEAFVKACGDGLFMPLESFSVSLKPNEPARLLHLDGAPEAPRKWKIIDFRPATGFAGALAVPCGERECRLKLRGA